MSAAECFFDTNVLLYLLSGDDVKADRAESLLTEGGHISVQALNEFAAVAIRKLGMSPAEVGEALAPVRGLCRVHPVTEETHLVGLRLAERYGLAVFDAMIAASAVLAGCATLVSEDMHDGLVIERTLRISNPFAPR